MTEKFLLWLYECSQRDYEDIHNLSLTTEECKELYKELHIAITRKK